MLGLVQHQVVEVEPVLEFFGEFTLRVAKPDAQGRGRLYLYLGHTIVDFGRVFHVMAKEGEVQLDGSSGQFRMGKGAKATFRCVFAGQHEDIQCEHS